jgi:hypothetical protein
MTVIVRVAGWLVGWLLFGFHVHETQQFVNSVQENAKIFTTLLLLPPDPPSPPPTLTTNHLVPSFKHSHTHTTKGGLCLPNA